MLIPFDFLLFQAVLASVPTLTYFERHRQQISLIFMANISCKCGIFPRKLFLLMLWWEGQGGGEQQRARHHSNTSTASADSAGSQECVTGKVFLL